MSEIYEKVSQNVINNLQNVNLALENSKIESKVLTPTFTEKLEKLKNFVNDENNKPPSNNSTSQLSPSFNSSEFFYSRKQINEAFSRIKALPKEFHGNKKPSEKKKPAIQSQIRGNLTRTGSLQAINDNQLQNKTSRSNSLADITAAETKPVIKVEELLAKIQENKKILEGINASALNYPKTDKFGEERYRLAKQFKKALQEVTEMVATLELNVKGIDKDDVDLVLDDELNELLAEFTKTIKDYNTIQRNSTIELKSNVNDCELEFPYSPLLDELKSFLD